MRRGGERLKKEKAREKKRLYCYSCKRCDKCLTFHSSQIQNQIVLVNTGGKADRQREAEKEREKARRDEVKFLLCSLS